LPTLYALNSFSLEAHAGGGSGRSCRENQNTHILCSVTFFRENPAFYEIMLKNIVEPDRSQMAV